MGKEEAVIKFLWGSLLQSGHLEHRKRKRVILKRINVEIGCEDVNWI
jgi:hypothetical protein